MRQTYSAVVRRSYQSTRYTISHGPHQYQYWYTGEGLKEYVQSYIERYDWPPTDVWRISQGRGGRLQVKVHGVTEFRIGDKP